ncbi:MAG: hypothetical protein NVS1B3_12420 [Candidatus Dormibacteraceae bacterium]
MPSLHSDPQVAAFDGGNRNAFDADPIGRAKSGVRRHRISQSVSDPNYVLIELEFASMAEAEAMHAALRNLWGNPLAKIGSPTARIAETTEEKVY